MSKINLREYYPDYYQTNYIIEIPDEVAAAMKAFPKDAPIYDYILPENEEHPWRFSFSIQIVSRTAIHIYTKYDRNSTRNHFCLTYDECVGLIHDIREKLAFLKTIECGLCHHCGTMIYIDQDRYKMDSGELIHGRCMEAFVRSEKASKVSFPAVRTRRYDVLGFNRKFPYYDRESFPKE